jgi:hypothetical protein
MPVSIFADSVRMESRPFFTPTFSQTAAMSASVCMKSVGSIKTSPATSLGNVAANVLMIGPPNECPTSTYGGGASSLASSACNSAAMFLTVGGSLPGSDAPTPARS